MKIYVIEVGYVYDEYTDILHVTDNYEMAKKYVEYLYPSADITQFDTDDIKKEYDEKQKEYGGKVLFFCRENKYGEIYIERKNMVGAWSRSADFYKNDKIYVNHDGEYSLYVLADNKDDAEEIFFKKVNEYKRDGTIERIEKEAKQKELQAEETKVALQVYKLMKNKYTEEQLNKILDI